MNFRNIILKQDQGTWFMTGPSEEGMIRPHTKPCRASPKSLVNTFYKNRTQFLVTV